MYGLSGGKKDLGMKCKRFFTDPQKGPYYDIVWERRKSEIRNPDGKAIFSEDTVIVPAFWSQIASDILAQKYFRKAGIPAEKAYEWRKWDSGGTGENPRDLDPRDPGRDLPADGAEHDARQVFHRLAFTWLDWGRKNKYFDSEEDEKAFYDETCYMLAHQLARPTAPSGSIPGCTRYTASTARPRGITILILKRSTGKIRQRVQAAPAARLFYPFHRRRSGKRRRHHRPGNQGSPAFQIRIRHGVQFFPRPGNE